MAVQTKARSKSKCKHCPRKKVTRGCCWRCVRRAYRAIERGEKTDRELVNEGVLDPLDRPGPKPRGGVQINGRKVATK